MELGQKSEAPHQNKRPNRIQVGEFKGGGGGTGGWHLIRSPLGEIHGKPEKRCQGPKRGFKKKKVTENPGENINLKACEGGSGKACEGELAKQKVIWWSKSGLKKPKTGGGGALGTSFLGALDILRERNLTRRPRHGPGEGSK